MPDPQQFTELDHFEVDPRSVRLLDEDFCRERPIDFRLSVVPGPADDALEKARAGLIPLAEILRAVPYRSWKTGRDGG